MQPAIKLRHAFANPDKCYADDAIELGFLANTGFSNQAEPYALITRMGLSPSLFLYIRFCGLWYAVNTMSTSDRVVVLSRTHLFFRDTGPGTPFVRRDIQKASIRKILAYLPEDLSELGVRELPYADTWLWDLEDLNGGELEYVYDPVLENCPKILEQAKRNAAMLLGAALLCEPVPEDKLGGIRQYFVDEPCGAWM
jgi:hypothetical protein